VGSGEWGVWSRNRIFFPFPILHSPLLTSDAIIVFNGFHQLVVIFQRDLCGDFSVGDFVLDVGKFRGIRKSSHGA
jgi:hypothetical protein